jgi:hypothetical protein
VSPLDQALAYADRGWLVFPRYGRNRPLVKWSREATTDASTISQSWRRWPTAEVALVTGPKFVVLDVDVKHSGPNGFDTLAELGFPFWFETPTAHTPSGGLHAYFRPPAQPFRNTVSDRGSGIGLRLDWRAVGGCVPGPRPGSAYTWDPHLGIDTPLAAVPVELLPREPPQPPTASCLKPTVGLSPYAAAALRSACDLITRAPDGKQEETLHREVFAIGTLAGAGGIPADFAKSELQWAAQQMLAYRDPWIPRELSKKVERSFSSGERHPR